VLADSVEPLVRVEDLSGVLDLRAYHRTWWRRSLEFSHVRRQVGARLERAAAGLPDGFGLAVFDAWRPLGLQQEIYQTTYRDPSVPAGFVSTPSTDPATPPPHLTGGAVDLTLTYRDRRWLWAPASTISPPRPTPTPTSTVQVWSATCAGCSTTACVRLGSW
jgi:D-alanyl-D-alanine dipeptidase